MLMRSMSRAGVIHEWSTCDKHIHNGLSLEGHGSSSRHQMNQNNENIKKTLNADI